MTTINRKARASDGLDTMSLCAKKNNNMKIKRRLQQLLLVYSDTVPQRFEILETFGHFFVVDVDEPIMHPVPRKGLT